MITENLSTLKIHKLTQEQYERELLAGRIDKNALYLTPDEDIDLSEYATIERLNIEKDSILKTAKSYSNDNLATAKSYTDTAVAGKADASHNHNGVYCTKGELDTLELITIADIDEICGATIYSSSEVMF